MKDKNLIRMNQLAGLITENQAKEMMSNLNENYSEKEIKKMLKDNDVFDEEGDIEQGTDEWMDLLSDIIGKDAFDEENITDEDYKKINNFIETLEKMGYTLY
jgi:molecular chaperone DnaK (HSP70)